MSFLSQDWNSCFLFVLAFNAINVIGFEKSTIASSTLSEHFSTESLLLLCGCN